MKKDNDINNTNENKTSEETTTITMPKKKHLLSKQARNYLIFGLMIATVTGLTLYFLLKEDPMAVWNTLCQANILPVLAIVGLVIGMIFVEGCVLTVITRMYNKKYHVGHGTVNGLIGSFFSNVTPFASGGQFVQVYTFTRQGVKAANAASILVMHFIVYQSVLLIYALVSFFAGFKTISAIGNVKLLGLEFTPIILSIVGFIINSFTILSLFFLAFCRPLHRLILNGGINILAKIHLIKNPEKKRTNLMAQVASFRIEFKRLITNYKVLILVFLLFVVKLTLLYSIPYFAGMASGANMEGKYFDSLFSSSYLAMITSFIPIPGGSGGAEWGFQTLFLNIYGGSQTITSASNILWRGLSYYMLTLIGGLCFAFYRGKPKVNTEKIADTQTFKDLDLTPFIHRSHSYELLEKRYAKMDEKYSEKNKAKLLTSEEIEKSFENLNEQLSEANEHVIDNDEDEELVSDGKKYLKIVMEETKSIEESSTDEEIENAIEEDRKKLEEAKLKKQMKKEKKKDSEE